LVSAAIEFIDGEIGLLAERPMAVDDLWTDVMRAVVGHDDDAVVLVCPTWWGAARVDRVRTAAEGLVSDVVVLSRGPLLARDRTAVVEIAAELLVVTGGETDAAVPILGSVAAVAAKAHAAVGRSAAVLIDAPAAVAGAAMLGQAIADRLRAGQITVAWADHDAVRRAAAAQGRPDDDSSEGPRAVRCLRKASAVAGVAAAVAVGGAFAVGPEERAATRLLVEGRVGVVVPAAWLAQRITSGPGSARLQLVSPSNREVALQLTQSVGAFRTDMTTTAEALRAALDNESDDVFVEFEAAAADVRTGRPAVTYREIRQDRHVAWTVLVDRDVRIAIGCQSPPAREDLVREVCDQAVESAHVVP
jgi:type VII secretion-associated protein (TIGR03931 family)